MTSVTDKTLKNRFLGIFLGAALTGVLLTLCAVLWMDNWRAAVLGGAVTLSMLLWGGVLLGQMNRAAARFTENLCGTLDGMTRGQAPELPERSRETISARVGHHLRRLWEVMEHSRRQGQRDRQELQSLLSDISHQTKTPMANLKLLSETLRTRDLDEDQRQAFLETSEKQLDKLEFLISAMVKTSRLESGMIDLDLRPGPVMETIALALGTVLGPLEQKGLELTVDCPESLVLCHDRKWTAEALSNLLDNAVKYTPAGGSIRVTAEAGEMYARICVRDTGRGIPEGEQAAIWGRFYREAAVHDEAGVGIGLYLTREIVTRQGGYTAVSSQPGRGAAFSIYLPMGELSQK